MPALIGRGLEAACAAQGLCGSSAQSWCDCALRIPAFGALDLAADILFFPLALSGWGWGRVPFLLPSTVSWQCLTTNTRMAATKKPKKRTLAGEDLEKPGLLWIKGTK